MTSAGVWFARARPCDVDLRPHREAVQRIFARVERQPLLAGRLDHEHRLAGVDVLADLGDDHADDAVGRRPQDGLVEPPFEHRERGRRRLDLRVGDGALLPGRPGDRGVMVGLRLGDVGACARHVVLRLIERLLRGGLAARQVGGAAELLLRVFQPRFRLGDLGRQRGDLLRAHAGIDVIAVGGRGGQRRARLPDRRGQLDRRQLGHDVAGPDASPLCTLIAASWPPTSGATRTSVVRTTPTIGGVGSGRDSQYPPAPAATTMRPSATMR